MTDDLVEAQLAAARETRERNEMRKPITVEANLKTGEVTMDDHILGRRTIAPTYTALIRDQHALLCGYRDDGRKPSQHLLDDIAVYEYILAQADTELAADAYMQKKRQIAEATGSEFGIKKMDVARALGWKVTSKPGGKS